MISQLSDAVCVMFKMGSRHWYNCLRIPLCLSNGDINEIIIIAIPILWFYDDDINSWHQEKMVAIFHMTFPKTFSGKNIVDFLFKCHWNLFPINKPTLVHMMAWLLKGTKPLSEAIVVMLPNGYMRQPASMIYIVQLTIYLYYQGWYEMIQQW